MPTIAPTVIICQRGVTWNLAPVILEDDSAQVRAAMEETAALTGLPPVQLPRAPLPLVPMAT